MSVHPRAEATALLVKEPIPIDDRGDVICTGEGLSEVILGLAPIVEADGDDYPYAGEVEVHGKTGTLVMTVLSPDAVRLELDADDNGVPESTQSVAWDWLF